MKEHMLLLVASIIALSLAIAISVRISVQKNDFNKIVHDALETSEGYDSKFIQMVNKLEDELAMRASFGYYGQKDPMTGKIRTVVQPKITKPGRTRSAPAASGEKTVEYQDSDPVKLTAIIFDDDKKIHTAIVMDGERSYSVETGDKLRDRHITRITNDVIFMESATTLYRYDIFGNSSAKEKK
jgi:hypothetical protein